MSMGQYPSRQSLIRQAAFWILHIKAPSKPIMYKSLMSRGKTSHDH